jgi:hypothetical protein
MTASLTAESIFEGVILLAMALILGYMIFITIRRKGITGVLLGGPVSAELGSVKSWVGKGRFRVVVATTGEGKVVGLAVSQRGILSYDSTAYPLTPWEAREMAAVLRQQGSPESAEA